MDKFRIRSGDFIGIVIPGIILCINLIAIYWEYFLNNFKIISGEKPFDLMENGLLFLLFLILSYVIGVFLRLFSPDLPDNLSAKMRRISSVKERGITTIIKKSNSFSPLRGYSQQFPYFNYFMEFVKPKGIPGDTIFDDTEHTQLFGNFNIDLSLKSKLTEMKTYINLLIHLLPILCFIIISSFLSLGLSCMISILSFLFLYLTFIIIAKIESFKLKYDEFDKPYPPGFSSKDFINYCKLVTIKKSSSLGEEILFAEGLSRMFSGAFYACLFSIVFLSIHQIFKYKSFWICVKNLFNIEIGTYTILLISNLLLISIIIWGIRHVRAKEITTIFTSYNIVMKDKEP